MTESELRDSILALVALSAGAVKEDNAEVAEGLGTFVLLLIQAVYHKRHMAGSEWAEIDKLLASFREARANHVSFVAEHTRAAGVAADELEGGEPGSDGSLPPSPVVSDGPAPR